MLIYLTIWKHVVLPFSIKLKKSNFEPIWVFFVPKILKQQLCQNIFYPIFSQKKSLASILSLHAAVTAVTLCKKSENIHELTLIIREKPHFRPL